MRKTTIFGREKTWLHTSGGALIACGGLRLFARSFPEWRVVPYLLSVVMLTFAAAFLTLIASNNRGAERPARSALLAGAVFLAAAFVAVFLVNNVILGATRSDLATGVMSVVFAAVFICFCATALISGGGKALWGAAGALLSLVLRG